MKLIFALLVFSSLAYSFDKYGNLDANDQKYFKNDIRAGRNQMERIDLNVAEINKLHGEVAALKAEVQNLKKDIEDLKKK